MWAIRKVTSDGLLTGNKKKELLYTKNTHMFKLLINIVAAKIEALIISGNKFLYACELSHVLALSVKSSLLLKCCDLNQFFR
jgi:hypothetical protein